MKVVLLILVAVVTGCQSLAINPYEMAEYDPEEDIDRPTGLGWGHKQVSFMAYLSDCKDLGRNQHIKFDKVLLNDGRRYNPTTGVFLVPYSGVYSFSFAVAQKTDKPLHVRLMVNGKNIDGAVAAEDKSSGCHCSKTGRMGSNSATIHVCKGDSVYVVAVDGGHVEGSQTDRYTTFSGHLLYRRK